MANHRIRRKQHATAYNLGWSYAAQPILSTTPIEGNVLFLQTSGYMPDIVLKNSNSDSAVVDDSWTLLHHASDPVVNRGSNGEEFDNVFTRWVFWKYAAGVDEERTVAIWPVSTAAEHRGFMSAIFQEVEIVSTSSSDRIPDIQLLIGDIAVDTIHHSGNDQSLNPRFSTITNEPRYHLWFNFQVNKNTSITTAMSAGGPGSLAAPASTNMSGSLFSYRGTQVMYGPTRNTAGNDNTLQTIWDWWPRRTEGIDRSPLYPQSTKPSDWVYSPHSMELVLLRMDEGIPSSGEYFDAISIESTSPEISILDLTVSAELQLSDIIASMGIDRPTLSTAASLELTSVDTILPELLNTTLSTESSLALSSVTVGAVQLSRMAVFIGNVIYRSVADSDTAEYTATATIDVLQKRVRQSDSTILNRTVTGSVE